MDGRTLRLYSPAYPGGTAVEGDVYSVTASGSGAGGVTFEDGDGGRFVCKSIRGDFDLTVEVKNVPWDEASLASSACAGIMIRNSTAWDSAVFSLFRTRGETEAVNLTNIGTGLRESDAGAFRALPSVSSDSSSEWMKFRLIRVGENVYAYYATQSAPETWISAGVSTVQWNDSVLAGFFACKAKLSSANTVTCDFRTPALTPLVQARPVDDGAAYEVSWETNLPLLQTSGNYRLVRSENDASNTNEIFASETFPGTVTDSLPPDGEFFYNVYVNNNALRITSGERFFRACSPEGNPLSLRQGVMAVYYAGDTILATRLDSTIGANWTEAVPGLPANGLRVRYTTSVRPEVSGLYTFSADVGGEFSVSMDGRKILDASAASNRLLRVTGSPVYLFAGRSYSVEAEYEQGTVEKALELCWWLNGVRTPIGVSCFEPGVPGWSSADLGFPAGSAVDYDWESGIASLVVTGNTSSVSGWDAARLVYRKFDDSVLTLEAEFGVPGSGVRADAGLTVAAGVGATLPRAAFFLRPNGETLDLICGLRSTVCGEWLETVLTNGLSASSPWRLRIIRSKEETSCLLSSEGAEWTAVGECSLVLPYPFLGGAFAAPQAGNESRAVLSTLSAEEAWLTETLFPLDDAFVQKDAPDTCSGNSDTLAVQNGSEGVMMFDVAGLRDVSRAKLCLYCTQSSTSQDTHFWFRIMRSTGWNEMTVTWNKLAYEFDVKLSPWVDEKKDPEVIAFCKKVQAGEWIEVDVTEAVRGAAERNGKLPLHIYSHGVQMTSPVCFASKEWNKEEQRPRIIYSPVTGGSAVKDIAGSMLPCDDVFIENNTSNMDYSKDSSRGQWVFVHANEKREGLMKFDLSACTFDRVDSAILRLFGNEQTSSAGYIDFKWMDNTDWDEALVTYANPPSGVTPFAPWPATVPADTVRVRSPQANSWLEVELAPLVNKALKTPAKKLSLHMYNGGGDRGFYSIFASKENADASLRPLLILQTNSLLLRVSRESESPLISITRAPAESVSLERATGPDGPFSRIFENIEETAVYDLSAPTHAPLWYRAVGTGLSGTRYSAVVYLAPLEKALERRRPIIDTSITSGNTYPSSATLQFGTPEGGSKTFYAFVEFDPAGLEHTSFVRFRLRGVYQNFTNGEIRVAAYVTEPWSGNQVTWSTPVPGLTVQHPTPAGPLTNEVAFFAYPENILPYLEGDVSVAAKTAAKQGKMLTLVLAGRGKFNHVSSMEGSDSPTLLYPAYSNVFAADISSTVDLSRGRPGLALTWTPTQVAGATYSVTRTDVTTGMTVSLANGLTAATFTDEAPEEGANYTYHITVSLPNGQTATASYQIPFVVSERFEAVADTYIHSNNSGQYGQDKVIYLKDCGPAGSYTREGLIRFDLTSFPGQLKSAFLRLTVTASDSFNKDEIFTVEDVAETNLPNDKVEWSNKETPTWAEMFGANNASTPYSKRTIGSGFLVSVSITNAAPKYGDSFSLDVTRAVQEAKAKNQESLTFHCYLADAGRKASISLQTVESEIKNFRPYITVFHKEWFRMGTTIILR